MMNHAKYMMVAFLFFVQTISLKAAVLGTFAGNSALSYVGLSAFVTGGLLGMSGIGVALVSKDESAKATGKAITISAIATSLAGFVLDESSQNISFRSLPHSFSSEDQMTWSNEKSAYAAIINLFSETYGDLSQLSQEKVENISDEMKQVMKSSLSKDMLNVIGNLSNI